MALGRSFEELFVSIHRLDEALQELSVTLGDKPPHSDLVFVDELENAILEVSGSVQQALQAASHARQAAGQSPPDVQHARKQLTLCQKQWEQVDQRVSADLVAYRKLSELQRLGAGRGREWAAWAGATQQGMERCGLLVKNADQALTRCWQELVEHLTAKPSY